MTRRTNKQTDNSFIDLKIRLRKEATANIDGLRVLDCFAGENNMWRGFDTSRYYGIEMVKGKGKNLHLNNLNAIKSLDLSGFNVLDFDAYGIPFLQVSEAARNPTLKAGTLFFYTATQHSMSNIPIKAIKELGLHGIYKINKTMLNRQGLTLFYEYLKLHGIAKAFYYEKNTQSRAIHYGYFKLNIDSNKII